MPQRPILHLPQKFKPTPYPPEKVLDTPAAQLAGEQAYVGNQGSAKSAGVRLLTQRPPAAPVAASPQLSRRERRHYPSVIDLSRPGFLRLEQVLAIYPVSRASWYAGIGTIYPESVRLGPRSVAWRTEDIRDLIANPPAFPALERPGRIGIRSSKPASNVGSRGTHEAQTNE